MQIGDHVGKAPCEWCGGRSTGAKAAGPGTYAYHCDGCEARAGRFLAALSGSKLIGEGWHSSEDQPDLVIHRPGQPPTTIRDYGALPAKARRELLPPVPKRRASTGKRKAPARVLTPGERADDLAARKRKWKREGEALDAEIAAFAASGDLGATALGRKLGVTRQRIYQLATG